MVLLDVSLPRFLLILIEGTLIFDRTDIEMSASYILLRSGTLQVRPTPDLELLNPNHQPQTLNPKFHTPHPQPQTPNRTSPNPKPQTPNPKPQTPNPKPHTPNLRP